VESWPGKYGTVVAGIRKEDISTDDSPLAVDHERWQEMNGEWVLIRQLVMADKQITLEVAVARNCLTAHRLLFEHLVRPRSMSPLEHPALPYGSVLLDDIGDVCFALPQHGSEEFRSVEFVRNNIVFLLRTKGEVPVGLREFAETIDRAIQSLPSYRNWKDSKLWPSIDRFETPTNHMNSRSKIPLFISITDPGKEDFTIMWDLSSGGILEEKGMKYYYAEGSGPRIITLLVGNQSGLASSAQIELQVQPNN
jgi:hypothetical protein